jgi:hypothetical protein
MLPVIVPPIRKGICRFMIDFKIVSKTTIIYRQHPILIVVAIVFHSFPLFFLIKFDH